MEFATAPVDLEWLADLERRFEADYQAEMRRLAEQEKKRKEALRHELKTQDARDPDLERRFKRQEPVLDCPGAFRPVDDD